MWLSYQRVPTVAELVTGPVSSRTGPVDVNLLPSFAIPELAQKQNGQSKGIVAEKKLSMDLALWACPHQS